MPAIACWTVPDAGLVAMSFKASPNAVRSKQLIVWLTQLTTTSFTSCTGTPRWFLRSSKLMTNTCHFIESFGLRICRTFVARKIVNAKAITRSVWTSKTQFGPAQRNVMKCWRRSIVGAATLAMIPTSAHSDSTTVHSIRSSILNGTK